MKRALSTFRQTDVTKALKAAVAAGLHVVGFKVNPQGEISVEVGESLTQDSDRKGKEANEWDNIS